MTNPVHASSTSASSSSPSVRLPLVAASGEPASYSRLHRFAQCPLSYKLHYVDRLPAEPSRESELGVVLHRTLEGIVRDHVRAGCRGRLDATWAAAEYQRAWSESDLGDPAVYAEGLDLVKRWVAREGAVDADAVLGVELGFSIDVQGVRVIGAIDRVDRIGDDAVRVRDYKSSRIPPTHQEVDESLQLAIYDLVAAQLWPWARRIELGLDLLRHDRVVTTERTAEQREATRQYVVAMVARMQQTGDFPARLSTLCTHCDHRTQCPAYAEARSGRREHARADEKDLPAVAREREELALLLKILGERKDMLDIVLRAQLAGRDELLLEGRRYRLVTAVRKDYPVGRALDALACAGVDPDAALERLARIDGAALKRELDGLRGRVPAERLAEVQQLLDASARCSLSTRLTSTEVQLALPMNGRSR